MEITYAEEMGIEIPKFENEFKIAVYPFDDDDLHVTYAFRNDREQITRALNILQKAFDKFSHEWWEVDGEQTDWCIGDYCEEALRESGIEYREVDTELEGDVHDTFIDS